MPKVENLEVFTGSLAALPYHRLQEKFDGAELRP